MQKQPSPVRRVVLHALAAQEKMTLRLVSKGFSYRDIAERLFIRGETIKKHLQNKYRKWGASNIDKSLEKCRNDINILNQIKSNDTI